jgi:hypothetical protein
MSGDITASKLYILSKGILSCKFEESQKLILPGIAVWIAIGLRENRNEYKTLQLSFKTFIDIMCFLKAVMRIFIEVNRNIFFES